MRGTATLALCLLAPVAMFAGASSAQSGASAGNSAGTSIENAFRGALQDRSSHSADEALYVEKCSMCHRQMGMGTVILARRMDPRIAVLEDRDNLTPEFVTYVVRNGLGNMPALSRGEVSDAQLGRLAAFLAPKGRP